MRVLLLVTLAAASVGAATFVACSSDPPAATGPVDAGNGGADDGSVTPKDGATSEDGGGSNDAGADGSCGHVPPADGGNPCGALDFGKPAVPFLRTDAAVGETSKGGPLEPGIYDAVFADRESALGGSWRETFVVDASGKFTRIRQIQTTADAAPGPISYRAGTFATDAGSITFTYTCAVTADAAVTVGDDTLPYDGIKDTCGTTDYRYGAAGIRVTLKRR